MEAARQETEVCSTLIGLISSTSLLRKVLTVLISKVTSHQGAPATFQATGSKLGQERLNVDLSATRHLMPSPLAMTTKDVSVTSLAVEKHPVLKMTVLHLHPGLRQRLQPQRLLHLLHLLLLRQHQPLPVPNLPLSLTHGTPGRRSKRFALSLIIPLRATQEPCTKLTVKSTSSKQSSLNYTRSP